MSAEKDLSVIHIKDINLWAHVGVLEKERLHGQRYLLDISFWLDLDESSRLDELNKSIDYSVAIKAIQKLSFEINCLTIEFFSDQILNTLEALYGSIPMTLALQKCSPPIAGYSGSVSIEKKRNFSTY